jgi:hypothetical protein
MPLLEINQRRYISASVRRGDKLAQEQLSVLFRQVQTTRAAKAQELLAKRSQNKEK